LSDEEDKEEATDESTGESDDESDEDLGGYNGKNKEGKDFLITTGDADMWTDIIPSTEDITLLKENDGESTTSSTSESENEMDFRKWRDQ